MELSLTPTEEYLKHLKLHEGSKEFVYADTLGILTAGIGHKLTEGEKLIYKEGDYIKPALREKWLEDDSILAYGAALSQGRDLGINNQEMINALASVNYQLGTSWYKKFPSAYKALKEGNFSEAIKHIQYKDKDTESQWHIQTPKRTGAFMDAIRKYEKDSRTEN
jgi:GH24 family phage-related lysozyme (muramidase)